jgi:hypothetical protein
LLWGYNEPPAGDGKEAMGFSLAGPYFDGAESDYLSAVKLGDDDKNPATYFRVAKSVSKKLNDL